jgi:hypothetical protein
VSRTVYVVGTQWGLWPLEAWAIFARERDALRHVDAALYAFRVEALPVYGSYTECPVEDRELSGGLSGTAQRIVTGLRSRAGGELERQVFPYIGGGNWPDDVEEPNPWRADDEDVVYGICAHDITDAYLVELRLLYETREAAQHHSANGFYMSTVLPLPVYESYDTCPPGRRYDNPSGPKPWSQLMQPKQEPPRT